MRRLASLEPTVEGFITMLTAKITQYDQRQSLKDPYHNSNFMAIAFGSVDSHLTSKFKRADLLDSSDPTVLRALKNMIPETIYIKAITGSVIRAIDAYLENGTLPKYPVTSRVQKRKASDTIKNLEMRVARLERLF